MKLQRGKKSFTVNMQTPKGRELVKELVKKSDVLVENFGLGILEKWGLDWPDLQMINPRMILIRVKGMGCTGPHAADLTYGPNVGNTMATTYLWNYPGATTATATTRARSRPSRGSSSRSASHGRASSRSSRRSSSATGG